MFTELPIFLTGSLGYRVDQAGVLAAIPWLSLALLVYGAGFLSDRLTQDYSTGYVRKLIMAICKSFAELDPNDRNVFSVDLHRSVVALGHAVGQSASVCDHSLHHRGDRQLRTGLGEFRRQSSGHRRTVREHSDGSVQLHRLDTWIPRSDPHGLHCRTSECEFVLCSVRYANSADRMF